MPDSSNPPGLIVGIDIGGTKTHLRATGPNGYLRDHVIPSTDWRSRVWAQDARRLIDLSSELVGGAEISALGIGAHGCDDTAECAAFQAAFETKTPIPVAVVNDAELMPLALDLKGQIGVVAGTGSIAVHRTAGNDLMVAGGWGWIIGDEGSAAGLMREAVKAVAQYLDCGGRNDDPLIAAIFDVLEISNAARLGSSLGRLATAASVGSRANVIFDAAKLGSPLAAKVIADGGRALAELIARLKGRGVAATHVVAGGGVIVHQPLLWQAFTESLRDTQPPLVTALLFSGRPVEGAVKLAQTLLQRPVPSAGTVTFPT